MNPNDVDIIIYHGGCTDGFSAAYAGWKLLGAKAKYVPGKFGTPPPDVTGKNVVILDFSYNHSTVKEMIESANELLILDHHKSAMVELHDISQTHFDMTKSGAILGWEFFHPGKEPPKFLRYVQDRDLWLWQLPYSKEFSASFDMVEFKFEDFDAYCNDSVFDDAVKRGSYILAHKRTFVNKVVKKAAKRKIKGYSALVVNSSHWMSEIGMHLAKKSDVAIIWYYDHKDNSYHLSFRSDSPDIDVSEVAKNWGGGGHKQAAGCKLPSDANIEDIFDVIDMTEEKVSEVTAEAREAIKKIAGTAEAIGVTIKEGSLEKIEETLNEIDDEQ